MLTRADCLRDSTPHIRSQSGRVRF